MGDFLPTNVASEIKARSIFISERSAVGKTFTEYACTK